MSRPEKKDETPFIRNDGEASDAFGSKRLGAQEQVGEEQGRGVMEEGPSSPHDESQASKTRRSSL